MGDREAVLVGLVMELCADLEAEIVSRHGATVEHPAVQRRLKRDMESVNRARKFVRDSGLERYGGAD